MKKALLLFIFLFSFGFFKSQAQQYYWVAFTNKNNSSYSFSKPREFLSERAIERRTAQGIAIDSLDLPVNQSYIDQVVREGVSFVHASKWLNGITVKVEIDGFENKMQELPFVQEVQLTKPETQTKSAFNKFNEPKSADVFLDNDELYGTSVSQLNISNGQFLHDEGYKGKGMQIAVLDAGFYNADTYEAFDSLWINNQILGTKDFVDTTAFFSTDDHGMSVLSCMGGNLPGELLGTAPDAGYWLIRSEDDGSEFLIEEDNWVAAAEFADSVGVDVINSSLGYSVFDDESMNHSYAEMDGKTTRVTRGAEIAASRGMLVFVSVGNEGDDPWKYLSAPSDAESVIAVGAVNKDSVPAYFTSYGPAADGRIKPNVSTIGWNTVLLKSNGTVGTANGTSFSSPVMAGLGACLWQANPQATAKEIKYAIERSAHLLATPDSLLGYGIPNFELAEDYLKSLTSVSDIQVENQWLVYPNPFKAELNIQYKGDILSGNVDISLYTVDGRLLTQKRVSGAQQILLKNTQALPSGLLILKIKTDDYTESLKLVKSR